MISTMIQSLLVFCAGFLLSTTTAHVIQNILGSVEKFSSSHETSASPLPLVIWHGLGDKYVLFSRLGEESLIEV